MATPPVFSAGAVLTAAQMNAIGRWLIKTDTITSGTSKTITNAFSDDFDNYRIVVMDTQISSSGGIQFQFGTDASGYYGTSYYDLFSGGATGANRSNNGAFLWTGLAENVSGNSGMGFDVNGVRSTSAHKGIHGTYFGSGYQGWFGGVRATSSTYTSFTLLAEGARTFSNCKIYVYGYRK